MKILIIASVSSEKVLFATPAIRALKTELEAEVHLVLNQETKGLVQENPYVNQIHEVGTSIVQLRRTLAKHKFDWVIDLKNNFHSKILRFGLAKNVAAFRHQRLKHWIYIKTKINRLPNIHLADQYLALLKPLNVKGDSLGLDFFIPSKDEVEKEWLPESHRNGYAALAISSAHFTRKLPVNRIIELCDRINKPVVLVGDPKDEKIANEVEAFFKRGTAQQEEAIEELNKKAIIFNACGKFNFNQLSSLIKEANWVFTHDNLLMHVAASFKKPVYSIWGNTTPFFGTYPYRTQFTVFENNKLNCRPCSKSGFNNCPKGHFKCMNELAFDFYLPD